MRLDQRGSKSGGHHIDDVPPACPAIALQAQKDARISAKSVTLDGLRDDKVALPAVAQHALCAEIHNIVDDGPFNAL